MINDYPQFSMFAGAERPVDLDRTVTSQELAQQMDGCDPLDCVLHSHSPSVEMYFALRSKLESTSTEWLKVNFKISL